MSRLLEYRENLNLTQKELSKKSKVSVRTIQRIESGTTPKGYTLKALAESLSISEISLLKQNNLTSITNYNLINIINLSSLIVVFIPIVNFILPLVITLIKKQLNPLTKQIITIQILWAVIMITIFLLGSSICYYFHYAFKSVFTLQVLFLLLILTNALIILRNSIELNKNKKLYFNFKFNII